MNLDAQIGGRWYRAELVQRNPARPVVRIRALSFPGKTTRPLVVERRAGQLRVNGRLPDVRFDLDALESA